MRRPSELDLLLLRASLSDGVEARTAWQEVILRIGSVPQLNGDSYRLLPLLYRNLSDQGVDDPALDQLKGVYRHSWYANHVLFHEAGAVLGSLEQAGIDTMVLKGAALSRLYYDGPGSRPMEDVDVLVRRCQVRQAIDVLERTGWRLSVAAPIDSLLRTRHSAEWRHPRGQRLDLHWSPLWQPTDEQPFWERAIPLEIGGTQTRALCPEDQLLHLCVHGVNWNMRTPYWAADAVMLMRSREGNLEWRRLVDQARANELSLSLEHGLRFLADKFEVDIPNAVFQLLSAIPRSRSERFAVRIQLGHPSGGVFTSRAERFVYAVANLVRNWLRYRRLAVREARRTSFSGFATYQQQLWGVANRRQLLGAVLAKGAQILRNRVWYARPEARPAGAPLTSARSARPLMPRRQPGDTSEATTAGRSPERIRDLCTRRVQ
jgi:hypothetical protein